MRIRIPTSLKFPWGYRVKVRLVSAAELARVGAPHCKGCWREDLRTIYIDKSMTLPERVATLWHEYDHAKVDAMNNCYGILGLAVKRQSSCPSCGD